MRGSPCNLQRVLGLMGEAPPDDTVFNGAVARKSVDWAAEPLVSKVCIVGDKTDVSSDGGGPRMTDFSSPGKIIAAGAVSTVNNGASRSVFWGDAMAKMLFSSGDLCSRKISSGGTGMRVADLFSRLRWFLEQRRTDGGFS